MKRRFLRFQTNVVSSHFNTSAWLRQVFFSSVLLLSFFSAIAQTNWTQHYQSSIKSLDDIAYGAGKYVAVGDESVIQVSTDGVNWTTQTDGVPTGKILSAIVYQNGQFVVVGHGLVLTSPDGIIWTARNAGTANLLLGLAYGGGQFIAVGQLGTIITSQDGINWTTQTSGTTTEFLAIAYGGDKFVTVGANGLIKTSTNGLTWTTRTSGTQGRIAGITAGSNGNFVAVGPFSVILTSTNGITWTLLPILPGEYVFLTSVTYNPAASLYVAVSYANGQLITSTDGTNWTVRPSGTQLSLARIRYLNGQFMAVGEFGSIRSSPDGINWKALTIDRNTTFHAVAYGNGHYVAVGNYLTQKNSNTPKLVDVATTSTDGMNYSVSETQPVGGSGGGFYDVTFGNNLFVAVGGDAKIQTSVDGKAWVNRFSTLFETLNGVAYGGGRFVAVGAGLTVRSTDGITWTSKFTQSVNLYSGITYAQGQFVAVGYQGSIGTSTDGTVWTPRTSGITKSLESVAYGNGTYVAVGLDGALIRSADGISWTNGASFTSSDISSITFGNGRFVTVGKQGEIFTSPDGVTWTAHSIYAITLNSVVHGNGQFVAVGAGAYILTSPDDGVVPPANQPPVAPVIANQSGTVNQAFSQTLPPFTDPEGMALTYSVAGLPAGLNFTAPSTISGTPTTQGTSTVTVTATDPGNLSTQTTFTITINPVGNPGAFAITGVSLVSCQPLSAGQRQLVFNPQYAGLSGQPISFSVVNEMLPTLNVGPYTLGMYIDNPTITLKATQSGTAGEASFTYNWLAACNGINPPNNQAPVVVNGIPNQSRTVGQAFSYGIPANTFSDPNGDILVLSVTGLPAGLNFTAPSTISGTPTTQGTSTVTVTATDPGNLSTQTTFTITINPVGNPGAFAITGVSLVSCQPLSAGQRQLVFNPQYAGLSGQPISFSVVNEMLPTLNVGPYTLGMYIDNPTITLKATQSGTAGEASFTYNWLAACNAGNARMGVTPSVESTLDIRLLGNPVENGTLRVEVRGAGGQPLQLSLTDLGGHIINGIQVKQADLLEQHQFEMHHQSAGLFLLRVSTPTQMQTVKVLKR